VFSASQKRPFVRQTRTAVNFNDTWRVFASDSWRDVSAVASGKRPDEQAFARRLDHLFGDRVQIIDLEHALNLEKEPVD
jgi:hypothetical protein